MKNIILFTIMLMLLGCGQGNKNAILHIKSDTTDAVVYVDGDKQKGFAPIDVFLAEGVHELKVISNKYTNYIFEKSFVIMEFEEKNIYADFSVLVYIEEINKSMVYVEGGSFQMGSKKSKDEKPIHTVTISSFFMHKTEVTQAQYKKVMGKNPSHFSGCDDCPVERVSWHDATAFAQKVGKRLPTEAEWEYAARGGVKTNSGSSQTSYAGSNDLNSVAWYGDNSGSKTHPVAQKQANALGLYDMSGNVWEWCSDWYSDSYYSESPQNDPQGPNSGSRRVLRGGSWDGSGTDCRVAYRVRFYPDNWVGYNGFRLVRSAQ